MNIKNNFAKNLNYYLDFKKISRNKLCSELNIPASTLSDWINAKKFPRLDNIEVLANYFNIDELELLKRNDFISISTKERIKMTFNEKIDKFIVENNIPNLKQFALQAGIPYTTLRDFYDKQSADNSRISTIRKLSKYMHCSMDYLAYDDITDKNEILLNEDLRIKNNTTNEFKTFFEKYENILTDSDKIIIKTIIEQRIKKIDKELNEE